MPFYDTDKSFIKSILTYSGFERKDSLLNKLNFELHFQKLIEFINFLNLKFKVEKDFLLIRVICLIIILIFNESIQLFFPNPHF